MKMVYYCSVKGCKNNSKMKKKDPNIVLSFHAFPVKEATKQKWLSAIGRPSWKPPSFARVCSSHFGFDQISHKGCRIRMMDDAYPINGLPPNSNFEASNVEVCRICLATDLKMFSLQEGLLNTCLQSLAALKDNCSIDGLPLFVCYECSARLINCYNLIEQSSIAQAVLLDLFTKNGQVTKSLVKKQDRKALGLESSLQYHTTNLREYTFDHREYSIENYHNNNKMDPNSAEASEYLGRQLEIDENEKKTSKHDNYDDELHRRLAKDKDNFITKDKISTKKEIYKTKDSLNQPRHRDRKRCRKSEGRISVSDSSYDFKTESHVETEMFEKDDDKKVARIIENPDNVECPKYPCTECDTNFVSEEARRVHLLTTKKHRKKPDLCDPTPNPLRGTCSKCGTQFPTTRELISHLRNDHPRPKRSLRRNDGYPVKCEHCEEVMEGRWQHWLHVRRRHPDEKHSYRAEHNSVCQRCGKQFQNSTKLRMHELRHGPAALRCTECARAFHDKYALARHAHTHARAMHACSLCARAFRTKHNLARHQRVHTGETPYGCNLCGKRFKHSTSQRLHVRSVHCNLPAPKRNNGRS